MGIPGFNIWFSEKYAKAYVALEKIRVDHLYIDLNSVLHTVMRTARDHSHFHKLLHKRLNSILDVTSPTKSVMIAVDGPAPLAKLLTQRDRRKKSGRAVDEGETLTGVAITPGTTFMLDLTHSLTYFCCTKMSGKRFRNVVFELSDGTVKGEGEVKVLGRLARPWFPEDPNDTHVILGDDADLILMALTSYKENLFVANSSLNRGRLDRRMKLFSVNLLHEAWGATFLSRVLAAGLLPRETALLHAKLDLTLIAILAKGNDYLPGLRNAQLEGGSRGGLWPVYQDAASKCGGGGAGGSSGPGLVPAGALSAAGCVTSIDPATGAPRLDAGALARLLQQSGAAWGSDAVNGGSGDEGEWRGSKAGADPRMYLHGCVWLLQMYLTGQCPDYRFVYDGVAPSAAAVRAICEALVAEEQPYITLETFSAASPRADQPLLPVACALALLPANCRHLAAPCVRQLMLMPASDGCGGDDVYNGDGWPRSQPLSRFDQDLYYDLYGDCATCRELTAEMGRQQRAYNAAKQTHSLALNRLNAVRQGTAPAGEPSEQELASEEEAVRRRAEALKSQMQSIEARRKRHISSAHPYRRFPIEQLEAVAEAALAVGPISPEERFATRFGRPLVLRAFNNKPEAAAFIRAQGAALSRTPQQYQHQHPYQQYQQYQQNRGAASWQAQPRSQDYDSIFVPPPPPFQIDSPSFFPAIVRQEVLYDEYGSTVPVQMRLAPNAPSEVVKYLIREAESARTPTQSPKPTPTQPYKRARPPASPSRQQPPSAEVLEAAAPMAAGDVADVAAVGAADAGAPSPSQRGRKPKAAGTATAVAAAAAGVRTASGGNAAESNGGATGQPVRRARGRPKNSAARGSAAAAATAAAAAAVVAVEASVRVATPPAAAAAVGKGASGTVCTTAAAAAAAALGTAPPMPSSRLLKTAAGGGGGGGVVRPQAPSVSMAAPAVASYNPVQYAVRPRTDSQGYGGHAAQYGAPQPQLPPQPPAPTPVPHSVCHSDQGQHYTTSTARQYGTSHPYNVQCGYPASAPTLYGGGGGGPFPPASRPPPVPAPYRPLSPPAMAAAAAAAGRNRATSGPSGPRRI